MDKETKYARNLAIQGISNRIKNGNVLDAANIVYELDKKYLFPKAIVKKALNLGAASLYNDGNYESSIYMYSRLHRINPESKAIFNKLISSFEKLWYFLDNVIAVHESAYFTEDDILKYLDALSILINFHEVNFPAHKQIIDKGKQFVEKLEYIKKYRAIKLENPDKPIESMATYKFVRILDAIYDDMTLDQVYQEAARLLAPTIHEILSEKEKEDKSDKKKPTEKKNKKTKKP